MTATLANRQINYEQGHENDEQHHHAHYRCRVFGLFPLLSAPGNCTALSAAPRLLPLIGGSDDPDWQPQPKKKQGDDCMQQVVRSVYRADEQPMFAASFAEFASLFNVTGHRRATLIAPLAKVKLLGAL